MISTTQVRRWVQHHGQLIRQAEQVEVQAVLEHESLSDWQAGLAPRQAPRRPAAREQTFNEAMEHALAQPDQSPPAGVSASDWERVRQARPDETEVERLRRLGPPLQPGEMVAVTSEVGPMHAHGLSPVAQTGVQYRHRTGSALRWHLDDHRRQRTSHRDDPDPRAARLAHPCTAPSTRAAIR